MLRFRVQGLGGGFGGGGGVVSGLGFSRFRGLGVEVLRIFDALPQPLTTRWDADPKP